MARRFSRRDHALQPEQGRDGGFAFVQGVFAVAVLGATACGLGAFAGQAIRSAQDAACAADRHVVTTAVQTYFALHGTREIPATGTGLDRYELTLVADGRLVTPSSLHRVTASGEVRPASTSRC